MRDLLFKNLTSSDKRKRVIVSTEVAEKSGIRTEIFRHFVCLVKEIKEGSKITQPLPYLYLLKERKTKQHRQRFLCRIKGSVYAVSNNRAYLICFVHSLRINLKVLSSVAEANFDA